MEHDVGVAVTGEAAAVRYFDTAENQRALAGEGMNVETHAGPWRQASGEPLLGALEIGGEGELFEGRVAFDSGDLHSGCAQDGSFVRRGLGIPASIGSPERVQAKRLRRLHPDEAAAV